MAGITFMIGRVALNMPNRNKQHPCNKTRCLMQRSDRRFFVMRLDLVGTSSCDAHYLALHCSLTKRNKPHPGFPFWVSWVAWDSIPFSNKLSLFSTLTSSEMFRRNSRNPYDYYEYEASTSVTISVRIGHGMSNFFAPTLSASAFRASISDLT